MKRGVGALVSLVLIGALASPAGAASATDKKKRQQQIGSEIQTLRSQVDEASGEEDALLGQIDESHARLATLTAQVRDFDGRVALAQRALNTAQDSLAAQEQALAAASARLDAVIEQLGSARDALKREAVDAYVGQDRASVSAVLLNLKSQRDIAAAEGYASAALRSQQSTVDSYDQLREDADVAAHQVAAARDAAAAQRDKVAADRTAVQRQRDQLDAVRRQAAGETAHEGDLLAEVQSRKAEFESQIASLQAESDQISSFLRSLSTSTGGIVVSGHGIFSIPIPGAAITSGFGARVHPIFHTVRMHTGIDFGAGLGTPIRAAGDGTVVNASWFGGYGNATIIDHGNGLATLYGHQSRILVAAGQVVKRGQVIGEVGSTGFSTGPHLHFEVRANGTPVDPRAYL